MMDDGNVIIIDGRETIVWQTNTGVLRYGKLNIFLKLFYPDQGLML